MELLSFPFGLKAGVLTRGVIWTKIPSVPNGTSTIYLYYGNNLATSLSNGTNTFDFFEDNWVINPVIRSSQPSWEVSITYPMVFKEGSNYYMIYDGHGPSAQVITKTKVLPHPLILLTGLLMPITR